MKKSREARDCDLKRRNSIVNSKREKYLQHLGHWFGQDIRQVIGFLAIDTEIGWNALNCKWRDNRKWGDLRQVENCAVVLSVEKVDVASTNSKRLRSLISISPNEVLTLFPVFVKSKRFRRKAHKRNDESRLSDCKLSCKFVSLGTHLSKLGILEGTRFFLFKASFFEKVERVWKSNNLNLTNPGLEGEEYLTRGYITREDDWKFKTTLKFHLRESRFWMRFVRNYLRTRFSRKRGIRKKKEGIYSTVQLVLFYLSISLRLGELGDEKIENVWTEDVCEMLIYQLENEFQR